VLMWQEGHCNTVNTTAWATVTRHVFFDIMTTYMAVTSLRKHVIVQYEDITRQLCISALPLVLPPGEYI